MCGGANGNGARWSGRELCTRASGTLPRSGIVFCTTPLASSLTSSVGARPALRHEGVQRPSAWGTLITCRVIESDSTRRDRLPIEQRDFNWQEATKLVRWIDGNHDWFPDIAALGEPTLVRPSFLTRRAE
jgi:hypothetical protein